MKIRDLGLVLALFCWPVIVCGQIFFESSPNLAIPDGSCLDPVNGRGEGGVTDSIPIPFVVIPFLPPTIEVQIDHSFRADLQMAVYALPGTASATPVIVSLGGNASSTPILANGHDGSGDNYYAHFKDSAAFKCSSTSACGNPLNCTGPIYVTCRPDEPLTFLFANASATPQVVYLRVCDRDSVLAGVLRRWRVYPEIFIPVELQSFSVD